MKYKTVFAFLLILHLLSLFAFAAENAENIPMQQLELSGAQKIDAGDFNFGKTAQSYIDGNPPEISGFLKKAVSGLFCEIKANADIMLKIILVALCCCIMQLQTGNDRLKLPDISFYVCYMIIFTMCMKSLKIAMTVTDDAIDCMKFFMQAALPVFGSVIAASGGAAKTASGCGAVALLSAACGVLQQIVMPLGSMCAVCGAVGGVGINLGTLSAFLRKTVNWSLGIVMTLFTAFTGAHSFAAASIDNAAVKTAKFAAGNLIPIVGGAVSDTLDSVLACGQLVKSAVGAAGIIGALYVCLTPLLKLAAIIISYKLAAVCISPFADKRIVSALEGFMQSVSIFFALNVSVCLMFIICAGIVCAL